jgi:GTP-binding protein EngB required for normal cell division
LFQVVVVGKTGCGKSSLLDALLDVSFAVSRKDRSTMRPVVFNLVNNQELSEPRVTIKRDGYLDDFAQDVVVTDMTKLSEAIAERNVETEVPLYLNCEWKYTWNITFIDLPGIPDGSNSEDGAEGAAWTALALEYMAPSERIIMAVEEADCQGSYAMAEFCKQADPSLDRTLFVLSKLDKALETVAQSGGSQALNDYLSRAPRAQTTFWCSFPWGRTRSKYNTRDLLLEKTVQMTDNDVRALEELQFDRRFVNQFGVRAVRSFLVQILWRRFQEKNPDVGKTVLNLKNQKSAELSRVQNQLANLETYKLRAAASNYVMSFLQTVEKLVSGTLAGNPGLNGQTLAQELADEYAGPWMDSNHQVLVFDAEELEIPNADARLYGGQQFSRLLSEFRAVAKTISIGSISPSEVATAAGPTRINNASNLAWAASDLAQKRVQRALMPLVDHLYHRASFVLSRLADIVESLLESEAAAAAASLVHEQASSSMSGSSSFGLGSTGGFGLGGNSTGGFASVLQAQMIAVEEYPYFVQHIKAQYKEFVATTAANCAKKCLDEFYCTRIIYWDTNSRKDTLPDLGAASEEKAAKAVSEYAGKLFDELRERIVENVLLKCHNFFLVPMQTELWGEIQGKVTQLDDQAIAEMFQVSATREKFKKKEEQLRAAVKKLQEQESDLQSSIQAFSHPEI